MNQILTFAIHGLLNLSWLGVLATFLVFTQLTIFSVTIYLHRCQAHRALDLHPAVAHVFRFWTWLTTSMVTRDWVAIHRKHHAHCETPEDPHSPKVLGIQNVLWNGVHYYRLAKNDKALVEKYGSGCPTDWLEQNLYSRFPELGPTVYWFVCVALFGVVGIAFWALHMVWMPFWAAGVVNGLGHHAGYRNFETNDAATNLVPWGLWIGGEELHNNHHAFPSSAKFSIRKFEFDIGWAMIRLLQVLRLAKVKRVAPELKYVAGKNEIDLDAVRAVVAHKFGVMSDYFKSVIQPVALAEASRLGESLSGWRKRARLLLKRNELLLSSDLRARAAQWIEQHELLAKVCEFRSRLRAAWEASHPNNESLRDALARWCSDAEASGIRALQEFAVRLRGYALVH
jgi:stearoyl-CoA desaturase (Delta-9 desaturase)